MTLFFVDLSVAVQWASSLSGNL